MCFVWGRLHPDTASVFQLPVRGYFAKEFPELGVIRQGGGWIFQRNYSIPRPVVWRRRRLLCRVIKLFRKSDMSVVPRWERRFPFPLLVPCGALTALMLIFITILAIPQHDAGEIHSLLLILLRRRHQCLDDRSPPLCVHPALSIDPRTHPRSGPPERGSVESPPRCSQRDLPVPRMEKKGSSFLPRFFFGTHYLVGTGSSTDFQSPLELFSPLEQPRK